jgi:hypothetical protein
LQSLSPRRHLWQAAADGSQASLWKASAARSGRRQLDEFATRSGRRGQVEELPSLPSLAWPARRRRAYRGLHPVVRRSRPLCWQAAPFVVLAVKSVGTVALLLHPRSRRVVHARQRARSAGRRPSRSASLLARAALPLSPPLEYWIAAGFCITYWRLEILQCRCIHCS